MPDNTQQTQQNTSINIPPLNVPTPVNSGNYPVNAYNENVGITGNDIPSGLDTGRGLANKYRYPVIEPRDVDDGSNSAFGESVFIDPPPLVNPYTADDDSKANMEDMADRVRTVVSNTYRQDMMARTPMDVYAFHGTRDPRYDMRGSRISLEDTHYRLSDGTWVRRYESYIPGTDNEDRLARQQSRGQKWSRGLQKFVGKTLLYGVGGVVQPFYGIASGVTQGSLAAVFDNDFTAWLDDMDKRMNYSLAHYYKKEERDLNFWQSLDTANFWSNDFLSGLSFTAGAMLSAAVFSGFGAVNMMRGLSKLGAIAKGMGRTMAGKATKKAFKEYLLGSRIGKTAGGLMDISGFLATSTAWEASVEARSMLMEAEDNYIRNFERFNGRRPTFEEMTQFRKDNMAAANSVFAANIAVLSLSNIAVFGRAFNVDLGVDKYIQRNIFGKRLSRNADASLSGKARGKLNKGMGIIYNVGKRPFMEGIFEEGLQGVAHESANEWIESRYDPYALNKSLSYLEAIKKGFVETYGSAEGWKEIGIGMIIGALAGSFDRGAGFLGLAEAGRENKRIDEEIGRYNERNKDLSEASIRLMKAYSALNGQMTSEVATGESQSGEPIDMSKRKGVNKSFDDASFGRFKAADELGILDEEEAMFNKVIDAIPDADIVQGENISPDSVAGYKSELKRRFKDKLENYRDAKELADNLTEGMTDNTFRDYLANMAYNGMDSLDEARKIAKTISDLYGNPDIEKSLNVYANMSPDENTAAKRLESIRSKISELEGRISALDMRARTTTNTDDSIKSSKSTYEKEINKLTLEVERYRRQERALSTIRRDGYASQLGFLFGRRSDDNGFYDMTTEDILNAISTVRGIEASIYAAGTGNRARNEALAELLYDYRSNIVAYKNVEESLARMRDPRFIAAQEHGFTGLMQSAFSKIYEEEDSVLKFRDTSNPDVREILRNDEVIDKAVADGKLDQNEGYMFKTYNHMIARATLPDFSTVSPNDVEENVGLRYNYDGATIMREDGTVVSYDEAVSSPNNDTFIVQWGDNENNRSTTTRDELIREDLDMSDTVLEGIAIKIWNGNSDYLSNRERIVYNRKKEQVDSLINSFGEDPLRRLEAMRTLLDSIQGNMSMAQIVENNISEVLDKLDKETRERAENDINTLRDLNKEGKRNTDEYDQAFKRLTDIDSNLPYYVEELYAIENDDAGRGTTVNINEVVNKAGNADFGRAGTDMGTPSSSQNPAMLMVKEGSDGNVIISGKVLGKFDELNRLVNERGWTREKVEEDIHGNVTYAYTSPDKDDPITISVTDGLDYSRWSIKASDIEAFENATGILISRQMGNIGDGDWRMVYKVGEDGSVSPYRPQNTYGIDDKEVIDQERAAYITDGKGVGRKDANSVVFLVDVWDSYNQGLIDEYRKAVESGDQDAIDKTERKFMSNMVINILADNNQMVKDENGNDMDLAGSFVGVVRSLGKNEKEDSKMSKFRRQVFEQMKSRTRNFTDTPADSQISGYSGKVSAVRPGKPNLHVVRDREGNFSVQDVEFKESDKKMISNIGYVEVVNENGSKKYKWNLAWVRSYGDRMQALSEQFLPNLRTVSAGTVIPIVVLRHPNGHRYMYPVTLKGDRTPILYYFTNEGNAFLEDVRSGAANSDMYDINTAIRNLNSMIEMSNLPYDEYMVPVGAPFEANSFRIERAMNALRGATVMPDPKSWLNAKEDDFMDMLWHDATINIDLSNEPFIGPKFQFSLVEEPGGESELIPIGDNIGDIADNTENRGGTVIENDNSEVNNSEATSFGMLRLPSSERQALIDKLKKDVELIKGCTFKTPRAKNKK